MTWPFNVSKQEHWAYMPFVFSPEECQQIISLGKNKEYGEIGTSEDKGEGLCLEYRESKIEFINPSETTEFIYSRLTENIVNLNSRFFNFHLTGFDEALQLTEYNAPSGKYKKHLDCGVGTRIRKLSVVVQLSDPKDYEGGELLIHIGEPPSKPDNSQGMMIVFPSYILHEVTPVTKGTRHSLVGWTFGEPFR
jgi:PKHD-type hydroxylase